MARRGKHAPGPVDFWFTGLEAMRLGLEAQIVIGFRLMGMMGLWSVAPTEDRMMVAEKQKAFTRAGSAAATAMVKGSVPTRVMEAAMRPLRSRTTSNVKRLSRRGPKLPGTK
ncbi:antifreeze protein [Rhodobacteraceae bacterium NNCM2]|nr:antifreeze protein [Coraliihabitans acroporae]